MKTVKTTILNRLKNQLMFVVDFFRRLIVEDLYFLSVSCEASVYEQLQQNAQKKGMDMSDYLIFCAKIQMSKETRATEEREAIVTATTESNSVDMQGVRTSGYRNNGKQKLPVLLPNIHTGHPCRNLKAGVFPAGYTAKTCLGTCTSEFQYGKPCFYASNIAASCDRYVHTIK